MYSVQNNPCLRVTASHNIKTTTPGVWWRKVSDEPSLYSTINEVRDAIDGLPVGNKEMEFELLSKISNLKNVRQIIISLLNSSEQIQELAGKSYRHENGFSKLILTSSKTHSLRLHIYWGDSSENYQENVHNHRWDFSSFILKGTLVQDFFNVIDADEAKRSNQVEQLKHYIYTPLRSPDLFKMTNEIKTARYQTTFVETCFVRKKSELTISEGIGYHLHRSELHRVRFIKDSGITVTLILYTAPYNLTCDLYSKHEQFSQDDSQQHETKDYTVKSFKQDLTFAHQLLSE